MVSKAVYSGSFAETEPVIKGTADLMGPCWDYDKVAAANVPMFLTSTSAINSTPPLSFTQGMPFNMATLNAATLQYVKFIDLNNKVPGPRSCDSFAGQEFHCKDTVTNAWQPPAPVDPSNGQAAFFSFEAYKPKKTEYDGSTTTKILLKVTQVIGYLDSGTNEGKGGRKEGYVVFTGAHTLNGLLYPMTASIGTKQDAIDQKGHFGVITVNKVDDKPRVVLMFHGNITFGYAKVTVSQSVVSQSVETINKSVADTVLYVYMGTSPAHNWALVASEDVGSSMLLKNPVTKLNGVVIQFDMPYNTLTMEAIDWQTYTQAYMQRIWDCDYCYNNYDVEPGSGVWNADIFITNRELYLWQFFLPINKRGALDGNDGNTMLDMNRDDALSAYLTSACMGVVEQSADEPCTNGQKKCTKFFSDGAVGKRCQQVANMSYYAQQAAYSTLCGLDPVTHVPVAQAARGSWVKDALKLPDCACANYKQSQFPQKTMNSFNYSSFIDWLHKTNPRYTIPAEGYCWWPSCTDLSNSLRIDALFPANQSQEDPRCPGLVNCMKIGGKAEEPVAQSCIAALPEKPTNPYPGFTPAKGPGAGLGPTQAPLLPTHKLTLIEKLKTWPHQKWFIPVAVAAGVLMLAIVLYVALGTKKTSSGLVQGKAIVKK